tara:strand:+ start:956 stop:1342 length:387 start_codon:yes stop_codon:yes gene_type:complete
MLVGDDFKYSEIFHPNALEIFRKEGGLGKLNLYYISYPRSIVEYDGYQILGKNTNVNLEMDHVRVWDEEIIETFATVLNLRREDIVVADIVIEEGGRTILRQRGYFSLSSEELKLLALNPENYQEEFP